MFELIIEVTQDDIDHGTRGDCTSCPIAHGMKRALDEARPDLAHAAVYAGFGFLDINAPGVSLRAFTPEVAADFMSRFDYYGVNGVQPFTFKAQFN